MKRFITSIVAMAAIISASAMSYSQAREQAWFLTDKMAYELYLNVAQVDAVYEINLDYIMNVDVMGDIFGVYWERRTRELSYVLTNSQMHTFLATEHFYRPITWVNSSFHFSVYDRYPSTRFFNAAPRVYTTYRGEFRNSPNSRFEGKFEDKKPNVTTGRTLSTRTGVTSKPSNSGSGFTGTGTTTNTGATTITRSGNATGGGTITNGRTRPSDSMTTTTRTGAGNGNRNESKVTTSNSTATKVTTAASSLGSVRTGASTTRTVSSGSTSNNSSTAKSGATVNNNNRRH